MNCHLVLKGSKNISYDNTEDPEAQPLLEDVAGEEWRYTDGTRFNSEDGYRDAAEDSDNHWGLFHYTQAAEIGHRSTKYHFC